MRKKRSRLRAGSRKTFPCPDVLRIIQVMKSKGYKVFQNPQGHDLNIVGIQTADFEADSFYDWITVFYILDRTWNFFPFPGTTDPGTYYRKNPINVRGTAAIKPGQYRGAWKIGKHKTYAALQQKNPITVYRDANRNRFLDTRGMEEETGMYKINLHRASPYGASRIVGKWSAGCQVIRDVDHFNFLMTLCKRGRKKYGNSFTYTLLEQADFGM